MLTSDQYVKVRIEESDHDRGDDLTSEPLDLEHPARNCEARSSHQQHGDRRELEASGEARLRPECQIEHDRRAERQRSQHQRCNGRVSNGVGPNESDGQLDGRKDDEAPAKQHDKAERLQEDAQRHSCGISNTALGYSSRA